MIAAVVNGSRFAWGDWFMGILRSFIAGGAGAISSGTVVGLKDPQDWGLHSGHLFELMGIVFLATGLLHMCVFLQTHPVPQQWTGEDRRQGQTTTTQGPTAA